MYIDQYIHASCLRSVVCFSCVCFAYVLHSCSTWREEYWPPDSTSHSVHVFYPVPADFRAGVRVTFDWTRVHIVRHVFALLVFERCSLSLGARCGWRDYFDACPICLGGSYCQAHGVIRLRATWFWVVAIFGLGLLCISHAHTFYAQDVVRPRILSIPVWRVWALDAVCSFLRSCPISIFWLPVLGGSCLCVLFICCDACAGGYNHFGLLSLSGTYVTMCHRLL